MIASLKQAYSQLFAGSLVPGTRQPLLAATTLALDLGVSLLLLINGVSVATAHISAFLLASLVLLAGRQLQAKQSFSLSAGSSLRVLLYGLVQLALRAGMIASLQLYFQLSLELALLLGIVLATLLGNVSSALLLNLPAGGTGSDDSRWCLGAAALIICVICLRLVFFAGMEVIPQEAYYWNYAQHLAPGYLDHPPLVAATIWLGEALLGHSEAGTRLGAIVYGLLFLLVFYRYARLQVEASTALLATALACVLPYYFMGNGFLMTPDAPLTLAWALALYFFYRALVDEQKQAWYGVGFTMGLGMLSKYSIALLAPAALLFIVLDARARRVLLRKEPYLAVIVALLVFSPVLYWNATHDWASFAFQASGRFDEEPRFYLDMMLGLIMAMVTPLPLLALPYLFGRMTGDARDTPFDTRRRLFLACFALLPLTVFAINALKHEPRFNWTGPLWMTLLPLLAWLMVNSRRLRWPWLAAGLRLGRPMLFALLGLYAVFLHFMAIGLPAVAYPGSMARLVGWPQVTERLWQQQVELQTAEPLLVFVGMDKYFITSKLSYYGTPAYLGDNRALEVTGLHLFNDNALMFAYWHPPEDYRGRDILMLSRSRSNLGDRALSPYFDSLSDAIESFPVYEDNFALPETTIREYYYRVGYGYIPPASDQ